MSLWLMRAGSTGEFEQRFLEGGRIYFSWSGLPTDLGNLSDLETLFQTLIHRAFDGSLTAKWQGGGAPSVSRTSISPAVTARQGGQKRGDKTL